MIAIEQLASYIASDFNSLLKYFRGYWETTKNFLSNICSNKIIPEENFPDYSNYNSYLTVISSIYIATSPANLTMLLVTTADCSIRVY